jgi:hypothetical protein
MFGLKGRADKGDAASRQLQKSGVYTLGRAPKPFVVDGGAVEAVKARRIYSFWAGAWYTSVLSVLLFWLPPFGQMVAGYVGGRKAGTPRLGALAALAPMSILLVLFILRYGGQFVPEIDRFLGLPGAGAVWMSSNIPVFGPVVGFVSGYTSTFISTLWSGDFLIYPYALTVVFGYVGGIMSRQRQLELQAEGRDHPFNPVTVIPQTVVQAPAPTEEDPFPAAVPEAEPTVSAKAGAWKMRKGKKGKW